MAWGYRHTGSIGDSCGGIDFPYLSIFRLSSNYATKFQSLECFLGNVARNLKRTYKLKTINNTSKVSLAQQCIVRKDTYVGFELD